MRICILNGCSQSIKGGVTLVQIREKHAETGEVREHSVNLRVLIDALLQFLRIAQASKEICRRYNVPILINDRIDIALAIGADGVHLGQTDMPVEVARRLLPSNAIIGMTCNTVEHVKKAVEEGVDYVGLGPVWPTQTKKLTNPVVGVRGVGALLEILDDTVVKAVAIGEFKGIMYSKFHALMIPLKRGLIPTMPFTAFTELYPLTAAVWTASLSSAISPPQKTRTMPRRESRPL